MFESAQGSGERAEGGLFPSPSLQGAFQKSALEFLSFGGSLKPNKGIFVPPGWPPAQPL